MELEHQYALYYPTIEFHDYHWLWAASLLWDRIYRIIPDSYTPDDPDNVKALVDGGEIGIPIDPTTYAEEASDTFIRNIKSNRWNAAAFDDQEYGDIALHESKVSERLKGLVIARQKGSTHDEWIHVPTSLAAHYMTYLANCISERENLHCVSDYAAAWTCSTYFKFDGKIETFPADTLPAQLAALVLEDFIPGNITDLSPRQILEYRNKHRDERRRFMKAMQDAARTLATCDDPRIISDHLEDIKKDVRASLRDYRRSLKPTSESERSG